MGASARALTCIACPSTTSALLLLSPRRRPRRRSQLNRTREKWSRLCNLGTRLEPGRRRCTASRRVIAAAAGQLGRLACDQHDGIGADLFFQVQDGTLTRLSNKIKRSVGFFYRDEIMGRT